GVRSPGSALVPEAHHAVPAVVFGRRLRPADLRAGHQRDSSRAVRRGGGRARRVVPQRLVPARRGAQPGTPREVRLRQPDADDAHGRGLLLVDALASSWQSGPSRFGGTAVCFELADAWPATRAVPAPTAPAGSSAARTP